jgi:hypothetical protein
VRVYAKRLRRVPTMFFEPPGRLVFVFREARRAVVLVRPAVWLHPPGFDLQH